MTKKNYKALAETVGKFLAHQDISAFLADLEALFARDNPRFDVERWRNAVGAACQHWAEVMRKK